MDNMNELDDLTFKMSKKKQANHIDDKSSVLSAKSSSDLHNHLSAESEITLSHENASTENPTSIFTEFIESEESEEESWVAGSGEAAFFLLDMHLDLGEPIEQLGIEVEEDGDENVTDFIQRFGEKLLWDKGVNVTELDENDLRCGGIVLRHNITISEERLIELAEDCMVQKCEFLRGGPLICPP